MTTSLRTSLTVGFLLVSGFLAAQNLVNLNQERLDLTKNGMIVLGSWAAINLISSPILAHKSSGSAKYFHQMNGGWNLINIALAGVGYYQATQLGLSDLSLVSSLIEQQKIEKLLLFNAGLDVAYVATGLYLIEKSKTNTNHPDRLQGFGQSLILQGAWLFAFDLGFYLLQHHHGSKLMDKIEGLSINPTGLSLTLLL